MSYYSFECPKCGEEITAEVDVGEHMVDWAEECDACNYKFTENEVLDIYSDALEDCWGSMIDNAHELYKDRLSQPSESFKIGSDIDKYLDKHPMGEFRD